MGALALGFGFLFHISIRIYHDYRSVNVSCFTRDVFGMDRKSRREAIAIANHELSLLGHGLKFLYGFLNCNHILMGSNVFLTISEKVTHLVMLHHFGIEETADFEVVLDTLQEADTGVRARLGIDSARLGQTGTCRFLGHHFGLLFTAPLTLGKARLPCREAPFITGILVHGRTTEGLIGFLVDRKSVV